jgi:hypothetical protein
MTLTERHHNVPPGVYCKHNVLCSSWQEPSGRFERLMYHPYGLATIDTMMTATVEDVEDFRNFLKQARTGSIILITLFRKVHIEWEAARASCKIGRLGGGILFASRGALQ